MINRYRMVVFDWDGTVIDSAAAIVAAIQAACRDLDVPVPSDERARHVIGLALEEALRTAVPELPAIRYDEMVARYRFHYLARDHELLLFEGIPELLGALANQGLLLAVATGKSRVGLDRAMDATGLRDAFQATRCADECRSKPHPQMLLELLDEFGLSPADAVMVGDTTHDLQMAANAGVDAIGVAYGAHPRASLESCTPRAVVGDVLELARYLGGAGNIAVPE